MNTQPSPIKTILPNPALSPKARDFSVVKSVFACRLMTAKQIERLHFSENSTRYTAARICRRVLKRLYEQDILRRRQRRVGGIRAGSASFIYSLGPVGARMVSERRLHYYVDDPSDYFMEHTLALAELYVKLHELNRIGKLSILELQTEPECWRMYITLATGKQSLRPDMFVRLGIGNDELSYFIEMDRGTTFATSLMKKLNVYEGYYMSNKEQRLHGVFPQILWIVPSEKRQAILEKISAPLNERIPGITAVTIKERVVNAMTDSNPP